MQYYFAPMEGVTGPIYRSTFHRCFTPLDRYYTPFLSPTQDRRLTARQWSEIDPERNAGLNLVPQLLTNHAELFVWAAKELAAIGYKEVNLNLGCPSGTVVKKKKGSGLLGQLEILEPMLDEIYTNSPIAVSIKTRIGLHEEDEFDALLELYNRYPISELIIHPRIQKDMYRGDVRMSAFQKAAAEAKMPLCYNGDIFVPEDAVKIAKDFPGVKSMMLGRGIVANPGLVGYIKTGQWATASQVQEFHDSLYTQYRDEMPGLKPTLFKMRELWCYLACMFESPEKPLKAIRKAGSFAEYEAAVKILFANCPFVPDGIYRW